jgi:hypothetical protein
MDEVARNQQDPEEPNASYSPRSDDHMRGPVEHIALNDNSKK